MIPSWRKNYIRYRATLLNLIATYKQRADIKAYLEILLSLTTISIFAFFALKPTLLTIAELMKEIESKRSTLATMNEKIQNLSRAQTLFDQERDKIELVKIAVPKNAKPDVFIRQIEGLSNKHQTILTSMTLEKTLILGKASDRPPESGENTPLPGGANELSFSLSGSADISQYSSLLNFLKDIEKLRKPIKVDSFNFNLTETKEQKILVLTISGRVPYLK